MESISVTAKEAISLACSHHAAGRLREAEEIYRQILAADPQDANALHLLGVMANQTGRADEAVALIGSAISIRPKVAEFHFNLGIALVAKGRLEDAIASYRVALELKPELPDVHNNLGIALKRNGDLEQAIASFRAAVHANPNNAEARSNLGDVLVMLGQAREAILAYRAAIHIKSGLFETHNGLGNVLASIGQHKEALECYRVAIQLNPEFSLAYNNMGNVLKVLGDFPAAINCYRSALRLQPDRAEVYNNLGSTLNDVGELDQALAAYEDAIHHDPQLACAYSNLIFSAQYHPAFGPAELFEYCLRFSRQFEPPLVSAITPHSNDRSPDRCLRIGYLSPDLSHHPVGWFLLPLLRNHDPQNFQVFCYSNTLKPDDLTDQLRSHSFAWRDTSKLTDAEIAACVRADGIDVLVDLALHSGGNRLLVFAQKPAPVQVTWLGYSGTTGLSTMDYRITDPFLNPPNETDAFYSEKSLRLQNCFWCFDPVARTLNVNPLPATTTGVVTFGSFNSSSKVSSSTLEIWAELLSIVTGSKLLIYTTEESYRGKILALFTRRGIGSERIRFFGRRSLQHHLAEYHNVDIMLDTFPYAGGMTTCDALWMGVPVVTLRGRTGVGRGGVSILSNIGLTEWIADDAKAYVAIAAKAANDLPRLTNLRATLRSRMQQSPLMNAPRFATEMESAYREMWRTWCNDKTK